MNISRPVFEHHKTQFLQVRINESKYKTINQGSDTTVGFRTKIDHENAAEFGIKNLMVGYTFDTKPEGLFDLDCLFGLQEITSKRRNRSSNHRDSNSVKSSR